MKPKRILYLASASPRRSDILRQYGIPFTAIPNLLSPEPPLDLSTSLRFAVRQLAKAKALASCADCRGLVLGVDTIVTYKKKIYGKPDTSEEAIRFLKALSGRTHVVITAGCLVDTLTGHYITCSERNRVNFEGLSMLEIKNYVEKNNVMDKAGAYGIQDADATFISLKSGSLESVMGLPIKFILKILSRYDIVKG